MDTCFISLHSQCNWHWLWAEGREDSVPLGCCRKPIFMEPVHELHIHGRPECPPWSLLSQKSHSVCQGHLWGWGFIPGVQQRKWGSCAGRVWLVPRSEHTADVSGAVPVPAGGSSLCSQRSHSAQKALCSKPGVRASFLKLECVQIKQPWNKMQL